MQRRELFRLATTAFVSSCPRCPQVVPKLSLKPQKPFELPSPPPVHLGEHSGLVPPPRFNVGDRVRLTWVCDDEYDLEGFGKTLHEDGIVGGLVWNSPNSLPRDTWFYFIQYDDLGGWQLWEQSDEELSLLVE
jgi:hypothetical protein